MIDLPQWPFDGDVLRAPHQTYSQWAALGAVIEVPERNAWLITGYREAAQVLRHPATTTSPVPSPTEIGRGNARLGAPVHQTLSRMALLSNGPYHRRVRLALQPAFGADVVAALRPRIRSTIDETLDTLGAFGTDEQTLDVAAFSDIVVSRVLDSACAVSTELGESVRSGWARATAAVESPDTAPSPDTAEVVLGLHEELLGVMARSTTDTSAPARDVFVREAGRHGLGEVEAAANLLLVLTSGHRTLRHSLALAVHSLAIDPDQQSLMRNSPEGVASCVEELLRWDNAVPATIRVATSDMMIAGHRIEAGAAIGVLLAAANRDRGICPHPRELDVRDPPRRHLAFGRGAHFCPGAGLSRVLLTESLTELLSRTTGFGLASAPNWLDNRRGLVELRIALS